METRNPALYFSLLLFFFENIKIKKGLYSNSKRNISAIRCNTSTTYGWIERIVKSLFVLISSYNIIDDRIIHSSTIALLNESHIFPRNRKPDTFFSPSTNVKRLSAFNTFVHEYVWWSNDAMAVQHVGNLNETCCCYGG